MAGKINPPVAPPQAQIPTAIGFLLEKYVDTTATIGQKRNPLPIPQQTPCARKICQYCVDSEAINIPSRLTIVPNTATSQQYVSVR